MDAVFRRLAHGVYTIPTLVSLLPWMELCFTSWQQSSSVSGGMESMSTPSGSRRYTCADDRSSTWNLRHVDDCTIRRSSHAAPASSKDKSQRRRPRHLQVPMR